MLVDQSPGGADHGGHEKNNNGKIIILCPQSISAHSGGNNGGHAGYGGQEKKGAQPDRSQTGKIGQNILRRPWNQKNKKNNKIELFRILQEFQGLKFSREIKASTIFTPSFFVNRKMRVEPSAMPMRHNKEPSTAPKA